MELGAVLQHQRAKRSPPLAASGALSDTFSSVNGTWKEKHHNEVFDARVIEISTGGSWKTSFMDYFCSLLSSSLVGKSISQMASSFRSAPNGHEVLHCTEF